MQKDPAVRYKAVQAEMGVKCGMYTLRDQDPLPSIGDGDLEGSAEVGLADTILGIGGEAVSSIIKDENQMAHSGTVAVKF